MSILADVPTKARLAWCVGFHPIYFVYYSRVAWTIQIDGPVHHLLKQVKQGRLRQRYTVHCYTPYHLGLRDAVVRICCERPLGQLRRVLSTFS